MKIDDTTRNRILISASVLDQCNREKLPEAEFWERFIALYNERVGDVSGRDVARLLKQITELDV